MAEIWRHDPKTCENEKSNTAQQAEKNPLKADILESRQEPEIAKFALCAVRKTTKNPQLMLDSLVAPVTRKARPKNLKRAYQKTPRCTWNRTKPRKESERAPPKTPRCTRSYEKTKGRFEESMSKKPQGPRSLQGEG